MSDQPRWCKECGGPLTRWARHRHRQCMRPDTEQGRALRAQQLTTLDVIAQTGLSKRVVQKALCGAPVSPQTARRLSSVLRIEERLMVRRRR